MSTFAIRAYFEPIRSLGFASIGGSYMGIGTAFSHPVRMLYVANLTDATLMFSLNGVEDHFALPASGPVIYDFCSNKTSKEGLYIAEGDRLYVKDIGTPTSGSVYVTVIYSRDV